MVGWQTVQGDASAPEVERLFKNKEIDRYTVVIDSDGLIGKAHYEFEWKMSSGLADAKSAQASISVTFLNLRAKIGDDVAPKEKVFGSASYRLAATGFPLNLSIGGKTSLFVMPLLSWYLPPAAVQEESKFSVPDTVFDNALHVTGDGNVKSDKQSQLVVELNLVFNVGDKPVPTKDKPPTLHSIATFNSKTAALLSAEGEIDSPSGLATFRIKRK